VRAPAILPSRRKVSALRRDGGDPDRGSASLEFVITATVVIALLFTAIQVGLYSYARSIALTAAQEAANAERAYNAQAGAGQARASAFLATTGDGLGNQSVTVARAGQEVQVTVTGSCLSVIPGFNPAVRQTVHATVEHVSTETNP
jgi:Flp pilus assembly protein TadG